MNHLDRMFLVTLAVTVGMQLLCFFVAYACRFDKITDLAGSANFVLLAVLTCALAPGGASTRQIVVTVLVAACRTQLALWLFYRVLKRGKDARFDEVRDNFFFFLGFWVWQMLWVYVVSVSMIFVNSTSTDPKLGPVDYVGWAIFGVGWVVQMVADAQKHRFRSDPANRKHVCSVGVWRYSRHPNYFGEVLIWWGIFIAGCPVFYDEPAGFATVASPIFTMGVLLVLTGIPQAEGDAAKRWYDGGEMQREFEAYFKSTPPLWMCPPWVYERVPLLLKRIVCFELPMYEYVPPMSEEAPPEAKANARAINVHSQANN